MQGIARVVVDNRKWVLVILFIATVWLGIEAAGVPVDSDVLNFLPDTDSDVRFFKETGGKFGSNYINMVALRTDDLFTKKSLSDLRAITDALARINGVKTVLSLTNVVDMKKEGGGIEVAQLIAPEYIPSNQDELKRLRRYTLSNPTYVGSLVSADGRDALIMVRVEENADREFVAREIRRMAKGANPDGKLFFGGFTMIMEFMGSLMAEDNMRLTPITVVVVLALLYLGLGSLRNLALVMGTVGVSIVWTLGFMNLFGIPISLLTSVIPVVIIAIGASAGIYILGRQMERNGSVPPEEAARYALRHTVVPICLAGIAIAVGFLSLTTAPMIIFKDFGAAAAMGAVISMIVSMLMIPAILAILPYKEPRPFALLSPKQKRFESLIARLGGWSVNHPVATLFVALLACFAALIGIPKISTTVNLLSYFPAGSEPQESEQILQDSFGGSQLFIVNVRADNIRHPAVLEQMDLLSKRLRNLPRVNLPQSPADLVSMLNWNLNDQPGLPDTIEKVNNLWFFLDGQELVEQMAEPNATNAVVQARIKGIENTLVAEAIERVRTLIDETVSTKLAAVNVETLDDKGRIAFAQQLADSIAVKVRNDLEFFQAGRVGSGFSASIEQIILAPLTLDAEDRKVLAQRYLDYFRSDEADMVITDASLQESLAQKLASVENPSRETLTGAVTKAMPASLIADDPEGPKYVAGSLWSKARSLLDHKRAERAMTLLVEQTGLDRTRATDEFPRIKQLFMALAADLYAVNHDVIYVPIDHAHQITGRKPTPEEITTFEVRLTGYPTIATKFDNMLIGTQIKSLFIALIAVMLLLTFRYRSLGGGLLASVPMLFVVLITFGVMGYAGIPLDQANALIASLAIGIGIGYSIHFLYRLREELQRDMPFDDALHLTLTTTGRAILINTLAVALGFFVLVFSVMTPQKYFGSLIALTMILGAIGSLTVLPALLVMLRPAFLLKPAADTAVPKEEKA